MNQDNSNKSQSGLFSNSSLEAQLKYLEMKKFIMSFTTMKYGYPDKRKDQFKCDYVITLPNDQKWILFSASSMTSDRLKTKQWDSFHIKSINPDVTKAFVLCPDIIANDQIKYGNIRRYREYIRQGQDISSIDDILLHSEFINLIENINLGSTLNGSRAAKKGLNFEALLKQILENKQNLLRWKGNNLAAGFSYPLFESIVNKVGLNSSQTKKLEADIKIPKLPTYIYKDGTTKRGGNAKTDLILIATFQDNTRHTYTFSCKSTTKKDITVHQFPPKYCIELLNIVETDTQQLLDDYISSGGPTKFDNSKSLLLEQRLKPYLLPFTKWALHGSNKDGSTALQRADYVIIRYQHDSIEDCYVETIDECIAYSQNLNKGNFGTIFGWTVTSKDNNGVNYPALRIYIE
ncbi:MAG: MspI family type II restriction endonuclease [Clostridiales bacterium]|nr:MspI family type II restriction endonuclease [Clostridiales bacterium]